MGGKEASYRAGKQLQVRDGGVRAPRGLQAGPGLS